MKFEEIFSSEGERTFLLSVTGREFEEAVNHRVALYSKKGVRRGSRPGKVRTGGVTSKSERLRESLRVEITKDVMTRHFAREKEKPFGSPSMKFQTLEGDEQGFTCEITYKVIPAMPDLDMSTIKLVRPLVRNAELQLREELKRWFEVRLELVKADENYTTVGRELVVWQLEYTKRGHHPRELLTERLRREADPKAAEGSLEKLSCGVHKGQVLTIDGAPLSFYGRPLTGKSVGSLTTKLTVAEVFRWASLEPTDESARHYGFTGLREIENSLSGGGKSNHMMLSNFVLKQRLYRHLANTLTFEVGNEKFLRDSQTEMAELSLKVKGMNVAGRETGQAHKSISKIAKVDALRGNLDGGGGIEELIGKQDSARDSKGEAVSEQDEERRAAVDRIRVSMFLEQLVKVQKIKYGNAIQDVAQFLASQPISESEAASRLKLYMSDKQFRDKTLALVSYDAAADYILQHASITEEIVSEDFLEQLVYSSANIIL